MTNICVTSIIWTDCWEDQKKKEKQKFIDKV